MKATGLAAVALGGIVLGIYVLAWIELVAEHGAAEAVRLGFTLWPGNVIGFALLAIIIVCGGTGVMLLCQPED